MRTWSTKPRDDGSEYVIYFFLFPKMIKNVCILDASSWSVKFEAVNMAEYEDLEDFIDNVYDGEVQRMEYKEVLVGAEYVSLTELLFNKVK